MYSSDTYLQHRIRHLTVTFAVQTLSYRYSIYLIVLMYIVDLGLCVVDHAGAVVLDRAHVAGLDHAHVAGLDHAHTAGVLDRTGAVVVDDEGVADRAQPGVQEGGRRTNAVLTAGYKMEFVRTLLLFLEKVENRKS